MFLVDDIALFPVKSILSIFREIHKAAVKEMADEADSLRAELGELYQRLESGALTEEDFDAREQQILDRLDAIEARDLDAADDDDVDDIIEEFEDDDHEIEDEDEDEDEDEEDDDEEDDADTDADAEADGYEYLKSADDGDAT